MIRCLIGIVTAVAVAACGATPSGSGQRSPEAKPSVVETASPAASATPAAADLPYRLDCGPMEQIECEATASRIATTVNKWKPDRVIITITIRRLDGDYDLAFDDGTGVGADIN